MTIGSGRPMEDAACIAYRELIRWMAQVYGFSEMEAYMLLTQAGKIKARQHGRSALGVEDAEWTTRTLTGIVGRRALHTAEPTGPSAALKSG